MTTAIQLARIIKEAADHMVAQDEVISSHAKASSVDEIVRLMADKGYIDEASIAQKKAELMEEPDLATYTKVLSRIGGNPVDIASPEKRASGIDAFDSFIFGQ